MKINQFKTKAQFTVKSILDDFSLISQNINKISIHEATEQFQLLSTELGYFNKLTKFVVGNESSLLFLTEQSELVYPTIREVQKNPKKYFLMYPIPAFNTINNDSIEIEIEKKLFNQIRTEVVDLQLNAAQGFNFGVKFLEYKTYNDNMLELVDLAINGSMDEKYFWPDKNIIVNSNPKFALSILLGYFWNLRLLPKKKKKNFYIHKNDNIYIFATILNYLGASYYIQNIKGFECEDKDSVIDKTVNIKLPFIFKNILDEIFKDLVDEAIIDIEDKQLFFEYFNIVKQNELLQNERKQIRRFTSVNFINKLDKIPFTNELNKTILAGTILIPVSAIRFEKVSDKDKEVIYDLTSDRADATNYAIPFTPILKNSDGDILTLSTAFSEEALEDAKAFEPSSKEWFRNLNNGGINKYIKDDALLGLYALTKFK